MINNNFQERVQRDAREMACGDRGKDYHDNFEMIRLFNHELNFEMVMKRVMSGWLKGSSIMITLRLITGDDKSGDCGKAYHDNFEMETLVGLINRDSFEMLIKDGVTMRDKKRCLPSFN